MNWVDHAIFWHTYPLGLCEAPIRSTPTPERRLRRLIERLDHVCALGTNGLILGPIFDSATHGYDTIDHFRIDPRLGTEQDFDDLVHACRERGLRLVLDGVFSHVAAGHSALPTLAQVDPHGRPEVFEGHSNLLRLNHSHPEAVKFVAEVMNFWCDRGVDGWRLDAAYSVDTAFWTNVLRLVRDRHPQVWVEGEVIQGEYSSFVRESGVDTVTQYELWKAVWSSIAERNLFELDWTLRRHNAFLETFVPQTFIGNHDVTRIASAVGTQGARVAAAVLMTLGGVPSIYYGDELGLTGLKEHRLGGDDEIRPSWPMVPLPDANSMFSDYQSLIGVRRRHPWLVRATTEVSNLTNTTATLRSTDPHGEDFIDLEIDLTAGPGAIIRDANGTAMWHTGTQQLT